MNLNHSQSRSVIKQNAWVSADAPQTEEERKIDVEAETEALLEEARGQAEAIREEARQLARKAQEDAAVLRVTAQEEVQREKEIAREEGFREGLTQAREEAAARQAEYDKEFRALLEELGAQRDVLGREFEQSLMQVAFAIAEKILDMELDADDAGFTRLFKRAVDRLNAREQFTIHVNQREYDRFFAAGQAWLEPTAQGVPFTVVADDEIPPGGCVLRSQGGIVRAGVGEQLKTLQDALGLNDAFSIDDASL